MKVPFLDLQAQYRTIAPEVQKEMQEVLDTSTYILGPKVAAFEESFARYCGTKHCVAVNSGTAALCLLLQAHNIGPGDEVITVANSFFASAEAILELGATPVLVDCDPETALIDVAAIEKAITSKTKAILPVHLYGQPADMDAILSIARKRNVLVFEDACQAHGALYKGRKAGNLGDGAAFSFYPGKNLGAYGEGGAVMTNDAAIATKIRALREHGSSKKYHHDMVGWNERMDGIQGAVLLAKLPHLDAWNAARNSLAKLYTSLLPSCVVPISIGKDCLSCQHLFVIRTPKRDALQAYLGTCEIQTGIHYPVPIHKQEGYRSASKKTTESFPHTEKLAKEILSLPMYAELTEEQVRYVCERIAEFFSKR